MVHLYTLATKLLANQCVGRCVQRDCWHPLGYVPPLESYVFTARLPLPLVHSLPGNSSMDFPVRLVVSPIAIRFRSYFTTHTCKNTKRDTNPKKKRWSPKIWAHQLSLLQFSHPNLPYHAFPKVRHVTLLETKTSPSGCTLEKIQCENTTIETVLLLRCVLDLVNGYLCCQLFPLPLAQSPSNQ